ncbi:hypothetical protein [Agrobacterium sp. SORGH_AS 787]|uniref:hypothetical protein n=1 Tax=Agrobacterium sp. SORGH_AS 787 TaxID=3041775 RepID=UPI002789EFEF|nr:hypothetical protein [Rhizobium sp. SORGH_AS_0787]
MSAALTKYLKDFSQFVPVEEPVAIDFEMPAVTFENEWASAPEPLVDFEEEKRKAFEDGEQSARQSLQENHQAELDALKLRHEEELEAQRVRFEEEIAGHLATSVITMKQVMNEHVEAACLKVLSQFVEHELAQKTAAELSAQVRREIQDGYAGTVKISGPEELLSKMRRELEGVDHPIDYEMSDDIDIQVHMDNSILMTRLSEFFQGLRGLSDE